MTALHSEGGHFFDASTGRRVKLCRNATDYANCNWVLPGDDPAELCISCSANRTIPNLGSQDNLILWTRIERAKKRLLYTLLDLGLLTPYPREDAWPSFQFLEDRRRNPNVAEDFVSTGHDEGVITLNLAEADDISRQIQRQWLVERYRTVLGHLRHEAGHYFFPKLTRTPEGLEACRQAFGDERRPYDEALTGHYETGPRRDWPDEYVSAYASVHPREDFAESFAHYLLIVDALETATAAGLDSIGADLPWIRRWIEIAITLNELSRSIGSEDVYPFMLTQPVIAKLELVDRLVRTSSASGRD